MNSTQNHRKEPENPHQKDCYELEEAVVASLLIESTQLAEVTGILTPGMFLSPDAAFVYQAIVTQYQNGIHPDLLTTEAEMRKADRERFEKMKGIGAMAHSLSRIRHSDNLMVYAREVKRLYLLRSLEALFQTLAGKAMLCKTDPVGLMNEADRTLLEIRRETQEGDDIKTVSTLASEVIEIHHTRSLQEISERAVFSGFGEVDAIFRGFHPGELYIGAGRPAEGKTAVALQIAVNAAQKGKKVLLFSPEMSPIQLMNRLFIGQLDMEPDRLRLSDLSQTEFHQLHMFADDWKEVPLFIDTTPVVSAANVRAKTLLLSRSHGCDMVIFDYLQLMETERNHREDNNNQLIGQNVHILKRLSLEAACPVLVLSQMNRNIEGRQNKGMEPLMSDLRDSGVIEQDADGIFFVQNLFRHGIKEDPSTGENLEGYLRIYISKNRNGMTGVAKIKHNVSFTRFI